MPTTPILRVENVVKAYRSHVVLNDISFTFERAAIVGLVGANGAGKTTLMRIAAGLQLPDRGKIEAGRCGYFGGFDTIPVRGRINDLRGGLGLNSVPNGDARLSTLSRGELQLAGLDAIFELGRDVLLLDEPWTALEPDRRDALTKRIVDYARAGHLVMCSSHELDEISRVATDVILLGGGAIRHMPGGANRETLLAAYREISRRPEQ